MKLEMQENIKIEFTCKELLALIGKFLIGVEAIDNKSQIKAELAYVTGLINNYYSEDDSRSVAGKLEKALALYNDDNENEK